MLKSSLAVDYIATDTGSETDRIPLCVDIAIPEKMTILDLRNRCKVDLYLALNPKTRM